MVPNLKQIEKIEKIDNLMVESTTCPSKTKLIDIYLEAGELMVDLKLIKPSKKQDLKKIVNTYSQWRTKRTEKAIKETKEKKEA